ncbi:MAG: DUF4252 domain-containing protein [Acidobacteriota bacterium]
MKTPAQSLMKFTSMNLAALVLVLTGASTTVIAQNGRIETGQLRSLAAKASETVDVNLEENLMRMATNFLSSKDPDEAKAKDLVNGLKGIYVKSFQFETPGQYSDADLESIRTQLRNPAWTRLVNVSSKKDGGVELYLMQAGGQVTALALLAVEPTEITFVNIIGPVDLEKLTELGGRFGIPELDIGIPRVKRKN